MKILLSLTVAVSVAVAMLANPALAHEHKAKGLSISHAWARATVKSAKTGAAYLTINNAGARADKLVAVKSGMARKTQIHLSSMHKGMMKMEQVHGVAVPAGGMAELKPGGYHVMFMGLKNPLKEGGSFPLTLVFDKAGEIVVQIKIMKIGAMGGGKMKH